MKLPWSKTKKRASLEKTRLTREEKESTKKPYRQILKEEVELGQREIQRSGQGLFLSGISAGVDVGFSLLVIAVSLTLLPTEADSLTRQFILANAYSVGFIFVKLGRSELFTEHTTLAVFPVLDRGANVLQLGRVWGLVYAGNLVGGFFFSLLFVSIAPELGFTNRAVLGQIAEHTVAASPWILFFSAVLAGWMMGLLSWLSAATKDNMAQIVCVWLVTATIGFGGLHHSILGSVECFAGLFTGDLGLSQFLYFLVLATAGNIVGGVAFTWLKYAHASRGAAH